ncbi:MAG TPA: NUDIX domain-containing protein [Candidatus Sulfomarinibacteraceae bacterium]|nr:NUDIX domain-containing protein [Candidatus Sulfomarinibacteraceae bacterium]
MARMVRWPPVHQLMVWGIRAVVPRHRVGVGIVALDEANRVLMLKHVFHPRTPWGLPGGWMGRDETPQTCAVRELKEETGLTATLGPVVHVTYDTHTLGLNVAFAAQTNPGPLTLSSEILSARWFSPDTLPAPILPFTREAIAAATALRATEMQLGEVVAP